MKIYRVYIEGKRMSEKFKTELEALKEYGKYTWSGWIMPIDSCIEEEEA